MKRTSLFVGLLASMMLLASCNKDDIELLRNPFRIQGELNPSFGLPVISTGQWNLNDFLSDLDVSFSGIHIDTNQNILTFLYDTSFGATIQIGGMVTKSPSRREWRNTPSRRSRAIPTKDDEDFAPFISRDTVIWQDLPIDIFNSTYMQTIEDANMSINEVLLRLHTHISGECPENVNDTLRKYVRARVDNLTIKYTGHDYQTHTFSGFANQSLVLRDLVQGGDLNFDDVNMAEIINSLPRSIRAGFHMHVDVDSGLLVNNIYNILTDTTEVNSFHALLDSLRFTSISFNGNLSVTLPFEVRIQNLPYGFSLPLVGNREGSGETSIFDKLDSILNDLLGEGAVGLDSSKVAAILKFSNGIPLDLTITGKLRNSNGTDFYTLFADQKIASSVLGPVEGHPNVVQTVRDSTSSLKVDLTVEALEKLTQADTLRLEFKLSTSNFDNDPYFRVIKRDDYLKIWMMVLLDPSIIIDKELFGGLGFIIDKVPFLN